MKQVGVACVCEELSANQYMCLVEDVQGQKDVYTHLVTNMHFLATMCLPSSVLYYYNIRLHGKVVSLELLFNVPPTHLASTLAIRTMQADPLHKNCLVLSVKASTPA